MASSSIRNKRLPGAARKLARRACTPPLGILCGLPRRMAGAQRFTDLAPRVALLVMLTGVHAQAADRLDAFRLLEYHDASSAVRPVDSAETWQLRRQAILAGMQQVMGPLPAAELRSAPASALLEEADAGHYVRRLITLETDPGCHTPAYLCIPKAVLSGAQRAPAVLCLHPTDQQAGHKVVVGLGGRPNRNYAAELADRGYVTLAPAYPHLANYWPNLARLGYESGTMKAIWDNIRAIDLLAALPGVDTAAGVGAIGHSLGGHNAIFTSVFDPRISVVVSSCGFDSFRDYYDAAETNWYYGRGWCQLRYMPRLSDYRGRLDQIPFDFPELLAALAPRRVFISAPQHDDNFRVASVARCVAAAQPVYELLQAPARLTVHHSESGHDFPDAVRAAAYRVIDDVLRGASSSGDR